MDTGKGSGRLCPLAGEGVTFDTSAPLIASPVNRIAALEVTPGTGDLVIKLGCDCHATAFLFEEGKLVVDVVDGPAPSGSPFETIPAHWFWITGSKLGQPFLPSGTPDQVADAELLFLSLSLHP